MAASRSASSSSASGRFTRREFIRTASMTGAATAFTLPLARGAFGSLQESPKKLKLLILGGTGFIGPHIVNEAVGRGHEVTLFNRGRTNDDLFPDLETLYGDRDPQKGEGLKSLEEAVANGRRWDGVVDTSGYYPRIVRASASLLADRAEHYVFISSISVYADGSKLGIGEEDAVGTLDDPAVETMGEQMQNYGPLKALCEQAASEAMGGRATNIRPGFIVGPRDRIPNRFNLWTLRVDRRREFIAPGTPDDPVQFIDARDLAKFTIDSIEKKLAGAYNATGPAKPLGVGGMIDAIQKGTKSDAKAVWIPTPFLEKHNAHFLFIPWVPPEGEGKGLGAVSVDKAVEAGLTFRPADETAHDTLMWLESDVEEAATMRTQVEQILANPTEDEILAAWRAEGE